MVFSQDAYCGLYCGACEILQACRRHEVQDIAATWKDLPETYHSFPDEAEIRCMGCRSEVIFSGCMGCKLRSCARARGVEYCVECEDYPCQITQEL